MRDPPVLWQRPFFWPSDCALLHNRQVNSPRSYCNCGIAGAQCITLPYRYRKDQSSS